MSRQAGIRSFVGDGAMFTSEQEVETKSWYLPTMTVEHLRTYTIGQFGTTKHIGAFATRAMVNWVADEPDDELHRTWARLQNDYEYNDSEVATWNYRRYTDYRGTPRDEKTALGFSAPTTVIDEFTSGLTKNQYGSELANAVETELRKRAQISAMQTLIATGEATREDGDDTSVTAPKVEVTEDGERADLRNITIKDSDTTATEPDLHEFAAGRDVDWETRRGLLAAFARGEGVVTKERLYRIDEGVFGVDKARSRRKDYHALIDRAESGDDVLAIAPAKKVLDQMGEHNLLQAAGLTSRNQPLEYDRYELFELTITLYNEQETREDDMWGKFVETLCDIAWELANVEWDVGDSITRTYAGKHLKDSIQRMLPVLRTANDVLTREDVLGTSHLGDEITEMIELLVTTMASIHGTGGKDIDEAYNALKEAGKTPKSLAFKKNN